MAKEKVRVLTEEELEVVAGGNKGFDDLLVSKSTPPSTFISPDERIS